MTLSAKCGVRLTRNKNCFSLTGTILTSVAAIAVARRGIDQRHLAEDVMVGQRAKQPIAETDIDLAALNDKELRRRIALLEDDLAGFEFAGRGAGAGQNAKIDGRIGHVASPQRCCNAATMTQLLQFHDDG
jgi:hypothetical protein